VSVSRAGRGYADHVVEAFHGRYVQPLLRAVGALDRRPDRHSDQSRQVCGDLPGFEPGVHCGHVRFSSVDFEMGGADQLEQRALEVRLPGGVLRGDDGPPQPSRAKRAKRACNASKSVWRDDRGADTSTASSSLT
jgi:hypothetical protein